MSAQVHIRGRLELVSGKGKACFLKIRQRTHTIQACPRACTLLPGGVRKPLRAARLQACSCGARSARSLRWRGSPWTGRPGWCAACTDADTRTRTVQAAMFVNDTTVSKGMVKYAQQLSRESVLDISGPVSIPEKPVEKCTQKEVRPPDCGTR